MADPLSGQGEPVTGPWDDFKSPSGHRGPWDDYKPTTQAAPDPNAPGLAESFLRGLPSGATFGFEDKLGLDKAKQEAAAKANPWTYFAGQVAGGFVPAVGASLLAPEVAVPAAVARFAPGLRTAYSVARSGLVPGEINSLGQAAVQGAKLGATYGGLSGAGHADVHDTDTLPQALEKRAMGAATGAVEGAVTGPVLGGIGHGIYRGAQGVGSMLAQAGAETAPGGAGALRTFTKGLERDQITPDQLIAQIRSEFPDTSAQAGIGNRFWGAANVPNAQKGEWTAPMVEQVVRMRMADKNPGEIEAALSVNGTGPKAKAIATLLDELEQRHLGPLNLVDRASMVRTGAGDNTQMQMRAAAATPGEHVGVARENFLERQLGANGRLENLIERTVGSPDLEGSIAANRERLTNATSKLYDTAFAQEKPFDLAPTFNKWEAQFDKMRGVVPDTVRARLDKMMWSAADADGNVVKTPPDSLQGFMYSREGLRDLIKEQPQGSNLRRHLSNFYDDITKEVTNTNPEWAKANALYGEGSQASDAVLLGKQLSTRQGAPSREALTALAKADKESRAAKTAFNQARDDYATARAKPTGPTPDDQSAFDLAKARFDVIDSRQQLMRTAYAQNLMDQIANKGESENLVRKMLLPGSKNIIKQIMGDDADQFIKNLEAERAMHRTYSSQFGSQTTPLREAVDEMNWAPQVEASLLNPMHWPTKILNLASQYAARTINSARNKGLMDIYTEQNPTKQLQLLEQAKRLHAIRSNWGNTFGTPVIMSSGPVSGTIPTHQPSNQPQPVLTPYRP